MDQESVSTEMSKQELKGSLKEVKFGGVIGEGKPKETIFTKKEKKARSPSILKNSRNILG